MPSSMLTEPDVGRRPDFVRLAVVIALAFVVRTWIIGHAEVPARDGVGFIRIALQLEEKPWGEVVRKWEQHPGYPLAILAVSEPVRWFRGTTPETMALSAELVSLLAGVLMVIPIYFLGKSLFDRNVGFVAAAILQCLPVFAQVTSDALSESLFLLLVATSLLFAVRGMQAPTIWRFFLCGICSGLAYLTRPEGAELVAATGVVLLIVGLTKWGVRATTFRTVALAAGVLPLIGLYVGTTGHLTNKPTANDVINGRSSNSAPQASMNSPVLLAAFWDPQLQTGQSRTLWSLKSLFTETTKSFHYSVGALAILGLIWYRRKLGSDPAFWVPAVYVAMHAALLWRMAVVIGYLSERHTLPIVLVGVLWAAAAILELGAWLVAKWHIAGRRLPATAVALILLSGLPSIVRPLHGSRAGHHAAGVWMAGHLSDGDEVIDPFAWAHYYSGSVFREGKEPTPQASGVTYIVLEHSDNQHSRLTGMEIALHMAEKGEPVYFSPKTRSQEQGTVVVYRVPAAH